MAIDILSNCHFDSNKIKTLYIGSRLTNGNPITYPIQYVTIPDTVDSIVRIEAWDKINNIVTIGGQLIQVNEITNLGDNLSFTEDLVIDNNGKRYQKTITFSIPKVTLFTTQQIKEFVMTSAGLFALAPTIAIIVDDNDNMLIVGYDKQLVLQNKEIQLGEENRYTLTYQSSSYSRARNCQYVYLPTVTTDIITSITTTGATGGGNVLYEGDSSVTVRGICWNTEGTPTIGNSKTINGSGSGTFTSSITGLTGVTTYYVRAYATNSYGTSYGAEVSFESLGMLYHWTFDNTLTDTERSLVLETGSTMSYQSGLINQAVRTEATDTWIHSTNATLCSYLSGVKPFSLSAWYYLPTIEDKFLVMIMNGGNTGSINLNAGQNTGTYNYVANPDSGGIRWCNRTRYGYYYGVWGINTPPLPVAGQWNHFVLTFDGTDTKFYINNALRITNSDNTSIIVTDFAWISYSNASYQYKIDLARIYNYALTASEISALYNGGSGI